MTAQPGKLLLLKMGDGATPTEAFASVMGFRSNTLSINRESVDVTTKESNGWSAYLENAGMSSFATSGSGVVEDAESQRTLVARSISGLGHNYQVIVPGIGTFAGRMIIESMEFAGEHNGEATFSISIKNSGPITFTAEGA